MDTVEIEINMKNKSLNLGFTLVELLIVVAIIAILASIGYPAYQDQIVKTNRTDAQANLFELSQNLERRFTENGNYTGATTANLTFNTSPQDGATKYNLSLAGGAATATTYTLVATPTTLQNDTQCGVLQLTHIGAKCATDSGTLRCSNSTTASDRAFVERCW